MKINPKTLEKLREARGLDQQALAEKAGVSPRTVLRIEIGESGETRQSTVEQIAKTLRVDPKVLAEEPESQAVRKVMGVKETAKEGGEEEHRKHPVVPVFQQVKYRLYSETILAYDLVAEQYGIDAKQIVNAAPLLFTLLAEMSLNERRRRAKKAEKAIDAFNRIRPEHMEGRSWDAYNEKISIAKRDLFARSKDWMEVNEFYYEEERNPFSDFLIRLAKKLGENDAIDPEEVHFDPDGFLNYVPLFEKFRKSLTGGSDRADYALSRRKVRIADISEELRDEDEDITAKRVRHLEAEVSDEEWDEHEKWINSLNFSLDTDVSLSKGGSQND